MGGAGARTKAEDLVVLPSWIPFHSTIVFRAFEALKFFKVFILDVSGVSEPYRAMKSVQGCQSVLIRSCNELQPEWLQLLGQIFEKPVVPVGLFPPSIEKGCHEALQWLDNQKQGSVVYVAFESKVKLSPAQVNEITIGLQLSELPFVWALRSKSVPVGLVERIKHYGRGLVFLDWVPRVQILAHPSVECFLMHVGWSSIVEIFAFGPVMVMLPSMIYDQTLNARHMVEKGFGVEVPKKEDDGSFTGDDIVKSLKFAMVENEGDVLRSRAKECMDMFGDSELHDL